MYKFLDTGKWYTLVFYDTHGTIFQLYMWRHRCERRIEAQEVVAYEVFDAVTNAIETYSQGSFNVPVLRNVDTLNNHFYTVIPDTQAPYKSPFTTRCEHIGRTGI